MSSSPSIHSFRAVGKAAPPVLGRLKVTGEGRFPPDYPTVGVLHAAVLRSDTAHAAISSLDVSAARSASGVAVVLTREDLGLDGIVRHSGDVVAAVAAATPEAAREAVDSMEVAYDRLPVISDPEAALAPDVPRLDPGKEDNLALSVDFELGDAAAALARADVVLDSTYRTGRPTHCNLSPRCCIARVDDQGVIEVMTSVDAPFFARRELAEALELPLEDVRIVLPQLLTSSFGGRSGINRHCEPIAAHLARAVGGQPIRLIYDPVEEFIAGTTRHATRARLVAGASSDGELMALTVEVLADHGPYDTFVNRIVLGACRDRPMDLYDLENYGFRGRAVLTNNLMGGEMRGIGATQISYILGSHMDELARRVGLDPIEFHMRNMAPEAKAPPQGGLDECLRRGAASFGWEEAGRRAANSRSRGIGVGIGTHTTGLGTFHGTDHASSVVTVEGEDGVSVAVASPDSGQGNTTIFAQIVSEELSVPVSAVTFRPIDTTSAPPDPWGSVASRSTYVVGSAVKLAAIEAREQLLQEAARVLDAEVDRLELEDGRVGISGDPSSVVTLSELVARLGTTIEGRAKAVTESTPPTYGAYFAEVDVDPETGWVDVIRMVAALDVGFAINPEQCRGQIEGALAHGIEFALGAEVVMEGGIPENITLVDYRAATAKDMPRIVVELVEGAEESGPYGARGIGTPAITPVLPAVANAVRDALSRRLTDVPMTPEVIWRAALGGVIRQTG